VVVPIEDVREAVGTEGEVLGQIELNLERWEAVIAEAGLPGPREGLDERIRLGLRLGLGGLVTAAAKTHADDEYRQESQSRVAAQELVHDLHSPRAH
jgi:hypothetical protein